MHDRLNITPNSQREQESRPLRVKKRFNKNSIYSISRENKQTNQFRLKTEVALADIVFY